MPFKDDDRYLMLLAGEWRVPQGEEGHENCNPTTGAKLGVVPEATEEEVALAVKKAAEAFGEWRQVPTDIRMKFGLKLAELIEEQREALVRTMATEMGKTRFDGHLDINEAVGVCQVVAPMAVSMTGKAYTNIVPNLTMESRVEPRGVAITDNRGTSGAIKGPQTPPLFSRFLLKANEQISIADIGRFCINAGKPVANEFSVDKDALTFHIPNEDICQQSPVMVITLHIQLQLHDLALN
ncbi:MAG: hypothetical protein IMHGJWDQ_001154 [Candidatus Fervidibacter sp.]